MKTYFIAIALCAVICAPLLTRAQLLPISAAEPVTAALDKAQREFASDAYLTNVVFAPVQASGITVAFDLATGKATGWLYRFRSPSADSSIFYIAAKIPLLGLQIVSPPAGMPIPVPALPADGDFSPPWADSPAALAGAKAGEAGIFLQQHPNAIVDLVVGLYNPVENPLVPVGRYWLMRFADGQDNLTCVMDAASGQSVRCGALSTGVETAATAGTFRLLSLHPSPLRASNISDAELRFTLDMAASVLVTVHDMLGRETARIAQLRLQAGEQRVLVPAAALAESGVYFIRLESDGSAASLLLPVLR